MSARSSIDHCAPKEGNSAQSADGEIGAGGWDEGCGFPDRIVDDELAPSSYEDSASHVNRDMGHPASVTLKLCIIKVI